MQSGNGAPAKLEVRWLSAALSSLDKSLEHIAAQDVNARDLVSQRLLTALDVIAFQPNIGTRTRRRNTRRFPIPKTGHAIEYRVEGDAITVTRWVRQARVRRL
ncbi:type II toxin-antitoxin system RelE/ParE family toxin [Duganella sp. S19_KUP01_CR8]|uniref:type II toxin-antitoxin system RelE/ParE family toxin n=1 Tax=Duganella sp. S19_KUP01_CR8 TaxID=3025502 RepID=UPI003FA56E49